MYRIENDLVGRRVIITFGKQADSDLSGFEGDLKAAVLRVRKTSRDFDLLVDLREAPVLPKEAVEANRLRMAWCVENGLRRSANITTSAIMKMQLQRVAADTRFRYFTSPEEAAAWLDSAD